MDLIRWEEKYSVGVSEIDNQHQQQREQHGKQLQSVGWAGESGA
jgi:hemerythrin